MKLKIVWILVFLAIGFVVWQFYWMPVSKVRIGMSLVELERTIGKKCEVEGLATAMNFPPREDERQSVPVNVVKIPSMGAEAYLNLEGKVIYLKFFFGTRGHYEIARSRFDKGTIPP